ERCGPRLRDEDRSTLAALADGDATRRGMLAHVRAVPAIRGKRDGESLAALGGMAWRRWILWRTRGERVPFADQRHDLDARPAYVDYGQEREPPDRNGSAPGRGRRRWRAK